MALRSRLHARTPWVPFGEALAPPKLSSPFKRGSLVHRLVGQLGRCPAAAGVSSTSRHGLLHRELTTKFCTRNTEISRLSCKGGKDRATKYLPQLGEAVQQIYLSLVR